ncbi:MAG: hypothetical protein ACI82I_001381 [Gammaproteobacteria bacterium]|jgi:hypothetical protein
MCDAVFYGHLLFPDTQQDRKLRVIGHIFGGAWVQLMILYVSRRLDAETGWGEQ